MPLLSPLQLAYGLAVRAKNELYDRGRLRPDHLTWPVVSIGNLSTGGAGKTPFTLELARLLQDRGIYVDVLSRGYGRRSPIPVERVPRDATDARRFGDEPVLLARAGVPVFVGASRHSAGLLAEQHAPVREAAAAVHLLDDGFQHRRLARDVDIVLLRPGDIGDGLLPRGRLREPIASLRRAGFLVLREDDAETEDALIRARLSRPIWRVRRSLLPPPVEGPCVAFAAIAHPGEFFAQLGARVELRATLAFRDHQRLNARRLRRIAQAARGAAAILTTEKDWVRLSAADHDALARVAPLHVVPLRTELLDAPACLASLLARPVT